MNYGSRRRYYRSRARAYRLSGRTSRYASSSQRRASGNYRAALQQRDQSQINLSIPTNIKVITKAVTINNPFKPDGSQTISIPYGGCAAINIWDLMRKSSFYQSYANMYDQVKIDRIRVKLTPSGMKITGNENVYNSYTVVTAWDRTGLSDEQLEVATEHYYDPTFGAGTTTQTQSKGIYLNIAADDIATYSSAVTKPVNSGANSSIVRTLYPRTTQEKGLYVNTADIDAWYEGIGENNNWYGVKNAFATQSQTATITDIGGQQGPVAVGGTISVIPSSAVHRNPCFVGESPTIPFKPTLLVGLLNKPIEAQQANGQIGLINPEMVMYVEADIAVSFRGLRKAPVVRTTSGINLPVTGQITLQQITTDDPTHPPSPIPITTINQDSGSQELVAAVDVSNAFVLDQTDLNEPITENGQYVKVLSHPSSKVGIEVNVPNEPPIVQQIYTGPLNSMGSSPINLSSFTYTESGTTLTYASTFYFQVIQIQTVANPRRYVITADYLNGVTSYVIPPKTYYYTREFGNVAPATTNINQLNFFGIFPDDPDPSNPTPKLVFTIPPDTNSSHLFSITLYISADIVLMNLPDIQ